MRLSRRGWNNVIIFAVIAFIAMIQLPEWVKSRAMSTDTAPASASSTLTRLLPANVSVEQVVFPQTTLTHTELGWQATPLVTLPAHTLLSHWVKLEGTPVSEAIMAKLQPQLTSPRQVRFTLSEHADPVIVTVYQLPQFWLLQNDQGEWLAVSVAEAYLFPPSSSSSTSSE
ncbi:hypothetical protein ACFFLZ_11765 [Photobacterium aphoticum]|uniref:Uncharacterized protein n=1 Tax=Photobacterium aphoticum TaxID=754436 RepID=A0A0J1GJN1_9GAMM|nr:hypothetical protein [Photobacterium aphoticum]KLU99683.1 hypothetical protein ABT58_16505 [Photobacterium aphoticum]PSU55270.1 hypothetical protein C9I90_16855 [Photobacterium aphoticum]GHA43826.1 hypothetical protein GCM10007086_16840 [Photobacterium aphoticum]